MKYFIFILPIISSMLLKSCNIENKDLDSDFEKEVILKGNIVHLDKLFKSAFLYQIDTIIVFTMTAPTNDKDIYLYSDRFQYIASSGIKGRGPGEIMNPFFAVPDIKQKIIYIMDQGRNKIFVYPIDSILSNNNYLPTKSVKLPAKYPVIVHYRPYNKNIFSFLNQFEEGILISFFDKKGKILYNMNIPDKINLYKNFDYKGFSLLSMYRFNNDKKKIVIAYRFEDAIFIIDKNGNILHKKRNIYKKIQNPDEQNIKITYSDIFVDNKYIYCSYMGAKRFVLNENGETRVKFPYDLLVYNWDLKPIVKFIFDMPFSSLVVDNKRKRFITWCPEKGTIVWYKIPDSIGI